MDPTPLGRSARTALEPSSPLGWAEIRHPFHPLRGQRFEVLKKRRIAGVDTLILRELERGSFSVAREWTDWGDPSLSDSLGFPATTARCPVAFGVDQLTGDPDQSQTKRLKYVFSGYTIRPVIYVV